MRIEHLINYAHNKNLLLLLLLLLLYLFKLRSYNTPRHQFLQENETDLQK